MICEISVLLNDPVLRCVDACFSTVPSTHLRLHSGLVPTLAPGCPGGRGTSLPVPVPGLPLLRGSEEERGGDHGNLPGKGVYDHMRNSGSFYCCLM